MLISVTDPVLGPVRIAGTPLKFSAFDDPKDTPRGPRSTRTEPGFSLNWVCDHSQKSTIQNLTDGHQHAQPRAIPGRARNIPPVGPPLVETSRFFPIVLHGEKAGTCPQELWVKAGAAGLLCCDLPEEYGGTGGDFLHNVIVTEKMTAAGGGGPAFSGHSDIAVAYIHRFGNRGAEAQMAAPNGERERSSPRSG